MKTVADRLQSARNYAGRSIRSLQQELHGAGVPGSSYANVHAFFGNKTPPSVEFLKATAAVLGVRAAWLAFDDGEMTWTRQADKDLGVPREEWIDDKKEFADLFLAVMEAIEGLAVSDIAEDVLRNYYYDLLEHRKKKDVPTTAAGIALLLGARFPRTVATSVSVDTYSSSLILFGEAAAVYGLDFLAQPAPWAPEMLEALRSDGIGCTTTEDD